MKSGFLAALFDLSFTEFITTRIIKTIYCVVIALAGLAGLYFIFHSFSDGFSKGLVALVLTPIVFVLYVALVRIWLELLIVIFRIAENTGRLVNQNKPQ